MKTVLDRAAKSTRLAGAAAPSSGQLEGPALAVRSFGLTDVGRVRSNNEDQFLIADLAPALRVRQSSLPQTRVWYGAQRSYLFAVADGVSGCQGGEDASALAVTLIQRFALERLPRVFRRGSGLRGLAGRVSGSDPPNRPPDSAPRPPGIPLAGMGTTLTLAYSIHRDLFVAHVGDSRAYLFRQGRLHRLTNDHTWVREMVRRGQLRSGEVKRHPLRHLITNVVGGPERASSPKCATSGWKRGTPCCSAPTACRMRSRAGCWQVSWRPKAAPEGPVPV